jgi:hypothetical protein
MAKKLRRALVDKLSHYRAHALVFRTREPNGPELEAEALNLACRFFVPYVQTPQTKFAATSDAGRITVRLPEGGGSLPTKHLVLWSQKRI